MQTVTRELTFTYDNAETYLTGDDIDLAYKIGSSKYVFRSSAKEGYATLNDAAKDVLFPTATAKIVSVESTFTEAHASTTNDNHKLQFQYAASDSSTFASAHTQTLSTSDYTGSVTSTALAGYTRDNAYRYYLVINSTLASARCTSTTLKFNFAQYECAAQAVDDGAASVSVSSPTAYEDDEVTFSATMAAGYEFDGWYNSSDNLVSNLNPYTTQVTSDLTLYAKATVIYSCSAVAKANIVSASVNKQSVEPGGSAVFTAVVASNATFDGWFNSSDCSATSLVSPDNPYTATISANTTLYAKATLNPTTYTCQAFSGSNITSATVNPSSVTSGSTATFTAVVSSGATFAGWYSDAGCSQLVSGDNPYTTTVTSNLSLYAKAVAAPATYSCSAVAKANVTSTSVSAATATAGSEVVFTAVIADGATFDGWYSNESCTTFVSGQNPYTATISGDTTLYAKASAATVAKYTCSAVAKSNIASASVSPTSVAAGGSATFTATANSDSEFTGWYSDPGCAILVSSNNPYTTTVNNDLTLYAKGTVKVINYSCAAVAGTGVTRALVSSTTVAQGSSCTYTATMSSGYTFVAWYSDSNYANLVSTSNPYTTTINANTTLYAKGRRVEVPDDNTYNVRIKHKRDTSANWTAQNPVLLDGEIIVVDTDNGTRTKTGDGDKRYSQLPFDDEILRNLIAARVLLDQGTAASGKILSVGTNGIVGVRTLKCEGGVSVSISDDKITISHDTSGVNEGTYGSTSNQTPAFGGTATVPTFAVTSAGHLTSAGNRTITIPSTTATTAAAGLMSASDKSKLNGIESNANYTIVDTALSSTSSNPVANSVVQSEISGIKTDLKNNYLSDSGDIMYGTLTFGSNGTIVLGSSLYGSSLPSSGTTGQIFFKKA